MSIKLALGPLQVQKCCQRKEEVSLPLKAEAVAAFLQEHGVRQAAVVIWQLDKILWGKWEKGQILLAGGQSARPELWLELRVFNETAELHLTGNEGTMQGRFLQEVAENGEPCEYVDSLARLWGEAAGEEEGWLLLEDKDRKLRQQVPAPCEKARFYGLVTRNYIGINQRTAQAGYEDYRYVKICAADIER